MTKNGEASSGLLSRKNRLRLLYFFCVVLVIYIAADVFQLPALREDFQADPTIAGLMVGAIIALAGIEGLSRIPGFGPAKDDE